MAGIVIASFGTTHRDTREKTIEYIERRISESFPEDHCIRAFTSRIVVKRLKKLFHQTVFNEMEAVSALKSLGIAQDEIVIQPLHVIPGSEYEKLTSMEGVKVADPLLTDEKSIDHLLDALSPQAEEGQAFVYFGHGSSHESDFLYESVDRKLKERFGKNFFMITAEGKIRLEDILDELKEEGYEKVKLVPFMIVAGEHAKKDMASKEKGSLKSILKDAGFQVETVLEGLGEHKGVADIFIEHLKEALEEIGK